MAFTLDGTTIIQTGGSDSSRDNPGGIISAGYGTLVSQKTINLGNYDLTISGYYEDTGWKYIYGSGKRFRSTSTANWKSGYKIGDSFDSGAIHIMNSPNSSSDDASNYFLNGGVIKWYDVTIDCQAFPTAGTQRLPFGVLDSASELDMRVLGATYVTDNLGDIALLNLKITNFATSGQASMRFGADYKAPDKLHFVTQLPSSGVKLMNFSFPGAVEISDFSADTGTGDIYFYHASGTDKRYILRNPSINPAGVLIYNTGEIIQIDVDVSIAIAGDSKNDYKFKAIANSDSYLLGSFPNTDVDGKSALRLENVWNGKGNTVANYLTPTTIVNRTNANVYGMSYNGNFIFLTANNLGSHGAVALYGSSTLDILITETTKTTVEAYTTLETSAKFYDYAKSWLYDNYAGETETIVSKSDDTINLGSYNLTIDPNASSVFAFDGSTITIKASTFTGSLKTTGSVTLGNGATVSGTIVDASADSSLVFDSIDSWVVYASQADRDSNTNAIASGISAQRFRFIYSSGTTYWLRLGIGEEVILTSITPVLGENVLESSINYVLAMLKSGKIGGAGVPIRGF